MAKFYGAIGFSETAETRPGVYEDVIVEKKYYGDAKKTARRLESGLSVNDNVVADTIISVLSDAYGFRNFFAIRYVKWMGVAWKVSHVDVQVPRLILTLGDVYHGPSDFVTRNTV